MYRKVIFTLTTFFLGTSGVAYAFLGINIIYSLSLFFLAITTLILLSVLHTRHNMKSNEEKQKLEFEDEKRQLKIEHQKQMEEQYTEVYNTTMQMTESILKQVYQILDAISKGTWEGIGGDYRILDKGLKVDEEIYEGKKGIKRVRPLKK